MHDSLFSDFRFGGQVPRTWPERVRLRCKVELRGSMSWERRKREDSGRKGSREFRG